VCWFICAFKIIKLKRDEIFKINQFSMLCPTAAVAAAVPLHVGSVLVRREYGENMCISE
jgi:hypothetical protein